MSEARQLIIDGVRVADSSDCYVIAEVGHNHQGSVEQAKKLFDEARRAGASAVKLQKRDNRSLFTREMFDKPYDNENSFGSTYGEHREYLEFGKDEYRELLDYARQIGITFFATAFDIPSADFLSNLEMSVYKIASGDLTNDPLLQHVGAIGKPVIISTGGATLAQVRHAHDVLSRVNENVAILQCTAGYPAAWDELNLCVIETFRREFPENVIGLSSHDNGIAMSVAAFVLGARIVEKHFTLNRTMKGTDHSFSLEPQGLHKLVRDLDRTRVALGDGTKAAYPSEVAPIKKMGKKLVAARDLPAGHRLTEDDIACKSPGDGLPPSALADVIGSELVEPLREDEPIASERLAAAEPEPASDAAP